jgi:hypothetical protein
MDRHLFERFDWARRQCVGLSYGRSPHSTGASPSVLSFASEKERYLFDMQLTSMIKGSNLWSGTSSCQTKLSHWNQAIEPKRAFACFGLCFVSFFRSLYEFHEKLGPRSLSSYVDSSSFACCGVDKAGGWIWKLCTRGFTQDSRSTSADRLG